MKTAIVTGGTSGIGLGVAKMLLSKGYKVYATYVGVDFCEKIENFETIKVNQCNRDELYSFIAYIKEKCNVDKYDRLNDSDINKLVKFIKCLEFSVVGLYPLKDSQVCSGGVLLSEISKDLSLVKYPNVFVAGELLNIDGMCGGYNLQFAWSSAGLIANSIKERIIKE